MLPLSSLEEMAFHTEETPDWLAVLSRALRDEASVLEQLESAMAAQRAAICASEDDALRASSQAVGRITRTLDEATERRASVVHYLTGSEDLALNQLEYFLGEPLPLDLDTARAQLRLAAQSVAREAAVNRAVLRSAKDAKDAFLQELFSADPSSSARHELARQRCSKCVRWRQEEPGSDQ
jgi:hypothetical protein